VGEVLVAKNRSGLRFGRSQRGNKNLVHKKREKKGVIGHCGGEKLVFPEVTFREHGGGKASRRCSEVNSTQILGGSRGKALTNKKNS